MDKSGGAKRLFNNVTERDLFLRKERLRRWKDQRSQKTSHGLNQPKRKRDENAAVVVQRVSLKQKGRKKNRKKVPRVNLAFTSVPKDNPQPIQSAIAVPVDATNNSKNTNETRSLDACLDLLAQKEELESSGFVHVSTSALSDHSVRGESNGDMDAKAFMEAVTRKIDQKKAVSATVFEAAETLDTEDEAASTAEDDQLRTLELLKEKAKKKKLLGQVDHQSIDYKPFRKDFYIEAPDLASLSPTAVERLRKSLDIKVKGKNCPSPITTWNQCGMPNSLTQMLLTNGFPTPFAIQQQAVPAIMKGRDVIGIAKTGSGKTLAFLLPLIRHVRDQPRLSQGQGPIGLIMAPARELTVQIYKQARILSQNVGMRVACVYGGVNVKDQIAALKRGCEIVVGTPGRLIDTLCMNGGRIVNLRRVTYVVLDEADRMFDMGFEPQISSILNNIRPDCQTLLFSATFPQQVEVLARKVLKSPIEISLGGRSVASDAVEQIVQVLADDKARFYRLLQLLGIWFSKGGNILVFVDTQKKCDELFHKLGQCGYQSVSLHGGKEQGDRDNAIKDFKTNVRRIMVATSVAGRGLDVPNLNLVVNYSCPNHMEDYVHRIGRTGRAGKKGTAYTFLIPSDEKYAHDIGKALRKSNVDVPEELEKMIQEFHEKVKRGEAKYKLNQYATVKGYTFDSSEMTEQQRRSKLDQLHFMSESGIMLSKEDQRVTEEHHKALLQSMSKGQSKSSIADKPASSTGMTDARLLKAMQVAKSISQANATGSSTSSQTSGYTGSGSKGDNLKEEYEARVDISGYPREVVKVIMDKKTRIKISDMTDGATFTGRGVFVPEGKKLPPGEEPLHLIIEADTEIKVLACKKEINRLLQHATLKLYGSATEGKYSDYLLL